MEVRLESLIRCWSAADISRIHVLDDIDLYVCDVKENRLRRELHECRLFGDTRTWLEHMQKHENGLRCKDGAHQDEFTNYHGTQFLEHLEKCQPVIWSNEGDEQGLWGLDVHRVPDGQSTARISPLFEVCPLCGRKGNQDDFERHLTGHQEMLVLLTLRKYWELEVGEWRPLNG